ncbi:hypothetical protein GJR88_04126 [Dietzia sp. DQ12-45-1b]|nr:hypothetical protein GJR88_04126 [Dietzia sp. DQ12-45-1b]
MLLPSGGSTESGHMVHIGEFAALTGRTVKARPPRPPDATSAWSSSGHK